MKDKSLQDALKLHQILSEEYEQVLARDAGDRIVLPEQAGDEEKLSLVWNCFHARKPAAICLSGGGIRSVRARP